MKFSHVATTVGLCIPNRTTSESNVSCSGLIVQHSGGRWNVRAHTTRACCATGCIGVHDIGFVLCGGCIMCALQPKCRS